MPNLGFERDVCYAAAPHTPLKLAVRSKNKLKSSKGSHFKY